MEKLQSVLEGVSFFKGLEQEHLQALGRVATSRIYRKGQTIFSEGEQGGGLYAVAEGLVRIYKSSLGGKEQILHVFGPGEVFAEVALFRDAALPANAQALEESEILFIPRQGIVECILKNPDLALDMLALLSLRLRGFVNKIEDLSLKEVPARLAAHILVLQASQGGDRITLDLPKGQLASLLGTIPETLSRMLKKLAEAGLLEIEGRSVRILDLQGLEEVALGKSGV